MSANQYFSACVHVVGCLFSISMLLGQLVAVKNGKTVNVMNRFEGEVMREKIEFFDPQFYFRELATQTT